MKRTKAILLAAFAAALLVGSPEQARADYQNVTIGLSGFTYNGKKLPDALADELDQMNDESPNNWLDRIDQLGKIARSDYWTGMPHLQPLFRKALSDRCMHFKVGKQPSVEAYEACFATELRNESVKARAAAKAGVTDMAKLALASPTLAAEITRRCGGVGADLPVVCISETLQSQGKALSAASNAIENAVGAWAIASKLRTACDEKYNSPENLQPCTSQKSIVSWRNTFRPNTDAPSEGVPSPVPPQPGCKPRSQLLEDTVAGCLNDGCGQATGAETANGCTLLANSDLTPFASKRVKDTVTFLDADSLVFLTRARVVSQLLAAHYKATGAKMGSQQIPLECKTNPELLAGIMNSPKPELDQPGGEIAAAAPRLTRLAAGFMAMKGQGAGLDDLLEGELIKEPGLLPLDANGEFDHDLSLTRSIDAYKAKPNRVLDLLRGNADVKTTEALKQVCKADWIELVNMPIARREALEIGNTISRHASDETCKESEQFPADMQAKNGKCMPWLLRCMFAQVTSEQKREMIGHMCTAASIGLAIVVPPAGYAAGAACAGVSAVTHAVARSDEADARKLAVVCTGLKPSECPASEIASLTRAMQHEIVAAGIDIVLQLGAPLAAGKVLALAGRGLTVALPEARALLAQLKILHSAIGNEEGAAGRAEAEALAAKVEALFNKAGVEMPQAKVATATAEPGVLADLPKVAKPVVFDLPVEGAPATPTTAPKLELTLDSPTSPLVPKPKPRLQLLLQPEEHPPLELDFSDIDNTAVYPKDMNPAVHPYSDTVTADSPTVVSPHDPVGAKAAADAAAKARAAADAPTVVYPKSFSPTPYTDGVTSDSPTVVYARDPVEIKVAADTQAAADAKVAADAAGHADPVTVVYPKGQSPIAYPEGVTSDSPTAVFPKTPGAKAAAHGINPDVDSLPDMTEHAVLVEDGAGGGAVKAPVKPPALPARAAIKPVAPPIEDVTAHAIPIDDTDDIAELLNLSDPGAASPKLTAGTPPALPRAKAPIPRAPAARPSIIDPNDLEDASAFAEPATMPPPRTVPETLVPSPIKGAPPLRAPQVTYATEGKSAEELAREATGATPDQPMQPLGTGGMNRVWTNPTDPTKAVKALDREVVWAEMKQNIINRAARAAQEGKPGVQKQYLDLLARYEKNIPTGDSVPASIDRTIAQVIQRHRVLGGPLRNQILPVLQKQFAKDGIEFSMLDNLETISDTGVVNTEKVVFGKTADGGMIIEAKEYMKTLAKDSPEFERLAALRSKVKAIMKPFNDEAIMTNNALSLKLSKTEEGVSKEIGYDFANDTDKFGNIILKLDAAGKVVKMTIGDF